MNGLVPIDLKFNGIPPYDSRVKIPESRGNLFGPLHYRVGCCIVCAWHSEGMQQQVDPLRPVLRDIWICGNLTFDSEGILRLSGDFP